MSYAIWLKPYTTGSGIALLWCVGMKQGQRTYLNVLLSSWAHVMRSIINDFDFPVYASRWCSSPAVWRRCTLLPFTSAVLVRADTFRRQFNQQLFTRCTPPMDTIGACFSTIDPLSFLSLAQNKKHSTVHRSLVGSDRIDISLFWLNSDCSSFPTSLI